MFSIWRSFRRLIHAEGTFLMPTSAPPHSTDRRRWAILAVLGIAQLMVVLDATVVNIALPSAQHALHFSDASRQWIVTAYALAFGSLLLLGGKLGDLFGRKWTFVTGLLGFAAASAVGGAAQNFEMLVGARAMQGVFGALLAPAALSLLTTTFPTGADRARAFGIFGAIAGAGGAIGLLLGGVLTEYLSWRFAMYVNLVFAIPAALGTIALVAHAPHPDRPRFDVPGVVTASLGLFSVVYGLSHAETTSWGNPVTVGLLAAALVLLGSFVAIQRRAEHPLLPLRVVLDRTRGGSFVAFAISAAGIFGVFLFLTYYLQQTLGYSPVRTGLAFLPMIGALMMTATLATARLAPRYGSRPLVPAGMLLAAAGMFMLTRLGLDSTYVTDILPALLPLGLGMGLIFAPSMSAATAGVATSDAGVASAMVNTTQQVGGAVGTALLNTLFAASITDYLATHGGGAAAQASASIAGYGTAFGWATGIFVAGAIITALILPSGTPSVALEPEVAFAH
jgi:EmrB/QacA subfamily drug resistance transporter